MFRSLRSRLLALLTVVVVITVGSVSAISFVAVERSLELQEREELQRQARSTADIYSRRAEVSDNGARPYPTALHAADLDGLADARVFYVGDTSLFATPDDPEPEQPAASPCRMTRDDDASERLPLKWNGEDLPTDIDSLRSDMTWNTDCGEWTGYAAAVRHGDETVGHVVLARQTDDISGASTPIALQGMLLLVGTLMAVWVVAVVLSQRITRPLGQLAGATRDIARGRYHANVLDDIPEGDEIGELANAFREMAVRLREVDSRDRRFLMSVSHELRTPLTAIAGHAQALEDGLADDAEKRNRSLAVIRREAGRLDRLVEDIIDLAKLRSNRFNTVTESVELNELGEHIMAIFHDQSAHPNVLVHGNFEDVAFYSDGHRILQILRNLINNALRYARTEVRVEGERVKNRVRIRVINDGDPVDPELQERIFEPFVGSKREGGMGLGLAISRELAWALGGNLEYVHAEDSAIFELTLPLEPPGSGR